MSSNNGTDVTWTLEDLSPYNYIPSRTVGYIFIVLFTTSTLIHGVQLARYLMYWIIPTICLCGFLEILGWAGRLWSSYEVWLFTPFQMQITCTIMAPTPLLAASFIIFGTIIKRLGPSYSRLSPKWCPGILISSQDVISLVIQGVGGGIAASAETLEGANRGARIMLGGIIFQLVVIIAFIFVALEFSIRYMRNAPLASRAHLPIENGSASATRGVYTTKIGLMVYALIFSTTLLVIRAIYRTIELNNGWDGPIISDELLFNVLDGAMIVLAIYTINIAHPGLLLAEPDSQSRGKEVA
ncbi:RTA1-like protein [Crassisporium funariophilum]|nr:RTA1-like protein [Crassisporium funariophilum]